MATMCTFLPFTQQGKFFTSAVLFDSITAVSFFIILVGTIFTLLCASSTSAGLYLLRSELTALLLFCSAGLMIITMSGEFLSFLIGLEITSLSLYVLVGYSHPYELPTDTEHHLHLTRVKSLESSLKYFLLGSGATAVMLMGAALIYAHLGTLKFENFYRLDFANPFALFGILLLLSGIAFKLGMAPFHSWVPDVYQGANAHLSAYMASMVKFSLVMIFIRILSELSSGTQILPLFFAILGVLSIVIGSLFGLVQNSIKRLLAYSSIANVGYLCLAFAALTKQPNSLFAKYLSTLILFIGYIMILFTKKQQGLHDILAKTLVVRD